MDSNISPFFVLTGPPGSGKTTLLKALGSAVRTVSEPARRVLAEQRKTGGAATGDQDPGAFIEQMRRMALNDFAEASSTTVFDRGLPDLLAYAAYYHLPDEPIAQIVRTHRYQPRVFFLPAWKRIYSTDHERTLDYDGAAAFGTLVREAYLRSGYELVDVPREAPQARAAFILEQIVA